MGFIPINMLTEHTITKLGWSAVLKSVRRIHVTICRDCPVSYKGYNCGWDRYIWCFCLRYSSFPIGSALTMLHMASDTKLNFIFAYVLHKVFPYLTRKESNSLEMYFKDIVGNPYELRIKLLWQAALKMDLFSNFANKMQGLIIGTKHFRM